MDGDRMDSLEGWVAVRPNLFQEPERYKMGFIVAWNQVDGKFAVTCHNRTAQRRKRLEGEDGEQSSWAGLYSVQDLEHIHRQLSSVCGRLQPWFPSFPAQQLAGSLWTLLFPHAMSWEGSSEELDAVCRALEVYLGAAIEECGRQIVLDVLFPEDVPEDAEKYFENLHEFRKKSLEEQVSRAKESLRTILHQHKNADKMMSLLKVYAEEDEAFTELVTVATQFHLYLLQPFRDMRELAILYKLEILKSVEVDDLGPKRIEALQKEADKWNTTAEEAERSIQNITVNYFKETSKALAAMQKHMELDGRRFGQATWASAVPRLERIKSMLAKESLQHMRSKELCLNQKRAVIKQSMENLSNSDGVIACLDWLELQYYETQLELYDVQFEILKHEEMLLIAELNMLRRQMKEKEEEVVYYDTCEDPQELQTFEQSGNGATYTMLRRKAQQLESKRGNICSRRALLRNKKDQCTETQELKLQQYQETQRRLQQHHFAQMKRDKKKEEEKKKKEWVDQERQRTLQRLKSFKDKKESHVVLKTSRIQSHVPSKSMGGLKPSKEAKGPTSGSADIPVQILVQRGNAECRWSSDDPSKQNNFPPPPVVPPPPPPPPIPPTAPPPPPPLPPQTLLLGNPAHIPHSSKTQKIHEHQVLIGEDLGNQTTPEKFKANFNQRSGSMEEVLASLKRSENLLRRVEAPRPSITSARDSILVAIRQGVTLKKVQKDPVHKEPENELEQSIRAAMMRMKKASADSDDEEKSEYISGDWDS